MQGNLISRGKPKGPGVRQDLQGGRLIESDCCRQAPYAWDPNERSPRPALEAFSTDLKASRLFHATLVFGFTKPEVSR